MKKELVDFDVIKEDFTVCEVENGQILKLKQSLIDLTKVTDDEGKSDAKLGLKEVSGVSTPNEIDTSDLEMAKIEDVTAKDQVKELEYKIVKQPTNIYETKNSIILISTNVQNIFLTNKKDEAGSPILRYTAQYSMSIIKKLTKEDIQSPKDETENREK